MIKPHLKFLFTRPLTGMLKFLEIAAVAGGLVIGMYIPVSGQTSIDVSIHPDSLTVGDKFQYINRVTVSDGYEIKPLQPEEKLGDAAVISEIEEIGKEAGNVTVYACTLAIYDTGEFEIPSFRYALTDSSGNIEEITGENFKVSVRSIFPSDSMSVEIADIREPYRIPGAIWPYIVGTIALAILIYGGYRLYRRTRGRPEIPQAPPRAPWEVAFEKLDNLKGKRHYEFGRVKQYYFELSLIVREYLEGRYGFPAVESTTYELARETGLKAIGEGYFSRLFEFFDRADMAKFAKATPLRNIANTDMILAFEIIRATIPSVGESEKKESEEVYS